MRRSGATRLPQFLLSGTLVALAVVIGARTAVDILVAALCRRFDAMGEGMGSLVAAFRGCGITKLGILPNSRVTQ